MSFSKDAAEQKLKKTHNEIRQNIFCRVFIFNVVL